MTPNTDDELVFAPEDPTGPEAVAQPAAPWRVLVVDDDPHVHAVTLLALSGVEVDHKPLAFEHAYDARQAKEKLSAREDWAVVLLDVVMETEDAGLELARWLREGRRNLLARVVLRTGQPGVAPERELMADYDVNDYQPKADLSAQRLVTSVTACLRAFRDLSRLTAERDALQRVVDEQAARLAALEPQPR